MRESLMHSIRILWDLVSSLLYFAKAWVFSLAGIVTFPLMCSRSSFSLRSKSILFFHARKVLVPTNYFLSLKKDIDVYLEWDIYLLDRFWNVVDFISHWRLEGLSSLDLDVLKVSFSNWTYLMMKFSWWLVAWCRSFFDLLFL